MLTLTDISYTYPSTPEPLFEHVSHLSNKDGPLCSATTASAKRLY